MHFSTSFLFTCLHLIESFHPYRHENLKRLELLAKLFEIEKRNNRNDIHIHSFKPELTFRTFFFENKL